MKYCDIKTINEQLKNAGLSYIEACENEYSKQLENAYNLASSNAQKHIVLLSGPSGSGKTTTALRIQQMLTQNGVNTHTISMDDYFLPSGKITNAALNSDGTPDLESPYRVDISLFKEHLQKLNRCEKIEIPKFDFANQTISGYSSLLRKENELVIIEGIHALNPLVTGEVTDFAVKLYVSVRTRLRLELNTDVPNTESTSYQRDVSHIIMHPRKIRLMRRLCRDLIFRGRSFNQSKEMFKSVSKGEDKYIVPHKKHADLEIDTFLPYEASFYFKFIKDALSKTPDKEFESSNTYAEMLPFFGAFANVGIDMVPMTSLVREFIGGSEFNY